MKVDSDFETNFGDRPLSYLPFELVNTGITNQYFFGPSSRDNTIVTPYHLSIRNVYSYESFNEDDNDDDKPVNWGVKKSYVDQFTEEFVICGVRCGGVKGNESLMFWHSDYSRIIFNSATNFDLYYQFSKLGEFKDESKPVVEKWERLFLNEGKEFDGCKDCFVRKEDNDLYDFLYSTSFEDDISYLASKAVSETPLGVVKVPFSIGDEGCLHDFERGTFFGYTEVSQFKQKYKSLYSNCFKDRMDGAGIDLGASFRTKFFDFNTVFEVGEASEDTQLAFKRPFKSEVGMETFDPDFYIQLNKAGQMLSEYFEGSSSKPLNSLILGAPGSGKTFVSKILAKSIVNCSFHEFNLSHISDPAALDRVFESFVKKEPHQDSPTATDSNTIVFFDEFDVTIAGTSMIRFLIDYIYEGKFKGKKFGKIAFLFAGGTIENLETVNRLQNQLSDFDLGKFLFDCSVASDDKLAQQEIDKVLGRFDTMMEVGEKIPQPSDTLKYLLRLDKLRDFLSRINGFMLEIPDISNPMAVTTDRFAVDDINTSEAKELHMRYGLSPALPNTYQKNSRKLIDFAISLESCFDVIFEKSEGGESEGGESEGGESEGGESEGGESKGGGCRFPYIITESNPFRHTLEYKNMLLMQRALILRFSTKDLYEKATKDSKGFLRKEDFLFLCTVPLRHGARSLGFITSKLDVFEKEKEDGSKEFMARFSKETFLDQAFQLHVGECVYEDIDRWAAKSFPNIGDKDWQIPKP